MKNLTLKIASICLVTGLALSTAQAETKDATFLGSRVIRSDQPTTIPSNPGNIITVGELASGAPLRGLLQFNIADLAIPQGATITSAKLVIGISAADKDSVAKDLSVGLYGVTQDFNYSQATWNNAATDTPWSTPGGVFGSTPLDSLTINSGNPRGDYEFSSAALTALIQQSLDSGDDLVGLILKLNNEAGIATDREVLRFGVVNSQAGDGNIPTYVPRLEITFAPIPEPSTVALMITAPAIGLVMLRRRRNCR